ncbi:MAG: hypothetical protein OXC62_08665 [Aestuariivita sp.]|nr:hypothetical protein [Aestuariivita sp.]
MINIYFLIWIDWLIYVAHMSSYASTRDHDGQRMQTAFSTVDRSDIRGLVTARRHFRRGATSL